MGRGQSPLPSPRRWGKPGGGHGPACRESEGAAGGSGGAERGAAGAAGAVSAGGGGGRVRPSAVTACVAGEPRGQARRAAEKPVSQSAAHAPALSRELPPSAAGRALVWGLFVL